MTNLSSQLATEERPDTPRRALAVLTPPPPPQLQLTADQVKVVAATVAKGATRAELNLFIQFCSAKNLDPFTRQVYFIKYGNSDGTIQIGIDGFRALAERSGMYAGQDEPEFRARGGDWTTDWDEEEPPFEARVRVYRKDFEQPVIARARYTASVGLKNGKPNSFWERMPELMLAKCAESQALRKAFPDQLAGLYTREEMSHYDDAPDQLHSIVAEQAAIASTAGTDVEEGEYSEVEAPPAPDDAPPESDGDPGPQEPPQSRGADGRRATDPLAGKDAPPAKESEPAPRAEGPQAPRTINAFKMWAKERGHDEKALLSIFEAKTSDDLKRSVAKLTISGAMLTVEKYEHDLENGIAQGADDAERVPDDDEELPE